MREVIGSSPISSTIKSPKTVRFSAIVIYSENFSAVKILDNLDEEDCTTKIRHFSCFCPYSAPDERGDDKRGAVYRKTLLDMGMKPPQEIVSVLCTICDSDKHIRQFALLKSKTVAVPLEKQLYRHSAYTLIPVQKGVI